MVARRLWVPLYPFRKDETPDLPQRACAEQSFSNDAASNPRARVVKNHRRAIIPPPKTCITIFDVQKSFCTSATFSDQTTNQYSRDISSCVRTIIRVLPQENLLSGRVAFAAVFSRVVGLVLKTTTRRQDVCMLVVLSQSRLLPARGKWRRTIDCDNASQRPLVKTSRSR